MLGSKRCAKRNKDSSHYFKTNGDIYFQLVLFYYLGLKVGELLHQLFIYRSYRALYPN
jgi:hypothetical protein